MSVTFGVKLTPLWMVAAGPSPAVTIATSGGGPYCTGELPAGGGGVRGGVRACDGVCVCVCVCDQNTSRCSAGTD